MVRARPAGILLALLLGSAALAGCGTSGEVTLPTALPSGSIERPSPTRTLPSETPSPSTPTVLPSATRSEPATPTDSAEPEPTQEPTSQAPTSEAPTQAPTPTRTLSQAATSVPPAEEVAQSEEPTQPEEPTQSEQPTQSEESSPTATPEPTETASETPSDSPSPTSASATESSSEPATGSASASATPDGSGSSSLPPWLGLAALVAAGGALAWFLTSRSRGRSWDERMEVELAQGHWVVAELVPALTNPATPPQQVTPYWTSAQPTLDQLEANVAELLAAAPDEARAAQARAISNAVAQVRSSAAAHVALVGSGLADPQAVATSASALQTARSQLSAALATTT